MQIMIFVLGQRVFIEQLAGLGVWSDWHYAAVALAVIAALILALVLSARRGKRSERPEEPVGADPE
ncbi:hypothetical protein [Erythrobacter sp. SG61-1L]|uniref:hypothetical protein n=1 Tax=Erythrobacter sp. SG61-1L TaxID=1603897 RepID=UPI0012E25C90|nr:hypothetical protein [Erythrobacter sp. SG61-1L]